MMKKTRSELLVKWSDLVSKYLVFTSIKVSDSSTLQELLRFIDGSQILKMLKTKLHILKLNKKKMILFFLIIIIKKIFLAL